MKDIREYRFFKELISLQFIESIWLYGSRARGDNMERSDIDLAIVCPDATRTEWRKVMDVIERADTLLKIDCVNFSGLQELSPLKQEILKFKKDLYVRKS